MASKKRDRKVAHSPAAAPARTTEIWSRLAEPRNIAIGFAIAVLCFYFTPLFDSTASIQWDTVDTHYTPQKYFADSLYAGRLPFWTPYLFSGMPFLADPQVGAWYPLNWPFFLVGVTSRSIEWELALHAFLALIGGYLLGRDLFGSRAAAVFCGVM